MGLGVGDGAHRHDAESRWRAGELRLDEALQRVRNGPQGRDVGAFFDFDGTVVHGFTGVHFFRKLHWKGLTRRELAATLLDGIRGAKTAEDLKRFSRNALRAWRGHTEAELDEIGARLFRRRIAGHLYPQVWRLIRAHQLAGHTVVLASSATRFQLEPAAAELGVEHVLCTQMETGSGGVLTGRTERLLWGKEKADAVRWFADDHNVDLARSYGYSNGGEDIPLLAEVGVPTAVNPDRRLSPVAVERSWPALRFPSRSAGGPARIVRTIAGFVAMIAAAIAGAVSALPSRDRALAKSRLIRWGSAAALAVTGVRVRAVGTEKLAANHPAVLLFNHQSQYDMIALGSVLGHIPVTAVAKQELIRNPVFGPIFRFLDIAFIDRRNTANAIAALRPVVDMLRSGVSVAIAPEGHRSLTPGLLPFKKGAFHLARQANVPIIPIVLRNAGEILWRNGFAARPGTIEVAVLDPIDATHWATETLDEHIEDLRRRYDETMVYWPNPH